MIKTVRTLVIILISSILVVGVLFFVFPNFWIKLLIPVKVEIKAANTKISEKSIDVDLVVILKDAKNIKYLSDSIEYEIILDGSVIVSGFTNIDKSIVNGDLDTVLLPISLSRAVLKTKTSKFEKGDSTTLIVKLVNHVDIPILGSSNIPYQEEFRVAAPQPPVVKVENVKKIKLKLKEAIYQLDLDIYNPNYVEISLLSADVYIDLKKLFKGNARSMGAVRIKPESHTKVSVKIDVDEFNLINDGLKIVFKPQKEWDYFLVAKVLIEQEDGEPIELVLKNSGKTKLLGLK